MQFLTTLSRPNSSDAFGAQTYKRNFHILPTFKSPLNCNCNCVVIYSLSYVSTVLSAFLFDILKYLTRIPDDNLKASKILEEKNSYGT